MKTQNIVIVVALLLLVGTGAFFGGMKYQESKRVTQFGQFRNGIQNNGERNQFQRGGDQNGFRPTAGEIISADNDSITVKLQDGSSKIIILTETMTINKASQGTKNDLKVGEQIAVFGNLNSDGSMTAQNIQLGSQFGQMRNVTPNPIKSK